MTLPLAASLTVLVLVSACTELAEAGFLPDLRDPTADNLALAAGAAAPVTPPGALPTGTVGYAGVLAAATAGDFDGSLYADLGLDVDFAAGRITGTIDNVDLVDDATGAVVQNLGGALSLIGTESTGVIAAQASGNLNGIGRVSGVAAGALVLAGATRTDAAAGDTLYGAVTGAITGGFDLVLTDGEFVAQQN